MQQNRFNRTNWLRSSVAPVRVFYGGGKSQSSTSQVSIPPEVLSQYSNVNSIANQVAQTPFSQYSTDPNAFVAPLDATQQAGVLGTDQSASEAQPFYQAASNQNQAASAPVSTQQIQSYENPYLSDVINPTSNLLNQQYATAQSGQLGNAINQGAFGGDRSAVAAANLQQQQSLAYGSTIGGLENQNYSQALGEANTEQQAGLAGATNEANIGSGAQAAGLAGAQAQLTAGQAQQQTEQAGETALYNQFLQQQSYPFQTTQFLANIAEGTGALSGSTTSSTTPAPFFSDERLKENIEAVGKLNDGQKLYKYNYKGDKQKHVGLLAQEVERKHPEAVGLAGGYKTVDYDAATADAARAHRAEGGGFNLDPSYLEAQQQAYAGAPWGNAGAGVGGAPYGGKSAVPPSSGGGHAQLAVAKAPAPSQGGLGGMASSLGQLEGLGKSAKGLWNDAKGSGVLNGLTGGAQPAAAQPATAGPIVAAPPVQPQPTAPPLANQPQPATSDANMGRANAGQLASLGDDGSGLAGAGSDADIADSLGDIFGAARGGLAHRDTGGPTFTQPTDADSDDDSAGGDVPYDSGTGMKGLSVPDDRPNNHLATASPPQQQQGGGGFNPMSLVTGALGLFGLKDGGRVGLAGGGDPGDGVVLPAMDDTAGSIQGGVAPPDQAAALAKHAAPDIVLPEFTAKDKAAPKVAVVAPKPAGLNPNAPSPDAQPVQNQQQQAVDMGAPQQTQPGQVLTQDNSGGVGDFLNKNQGLLVPLLHGLGTMASSNSRYLGSAVLQGLGGAADSYEQTQNEMQTRLGNQPIIQQRQNDASNSDLNLWQSYTAQNPGAQNLSFADFEKLKASGKLNSYTGASGGGAGVPPGGAGGYKYTVQEKNTGANAQGVPLSRDPAYLAGFAAHNAGIQSPMVQGQVHQANDQAGAINGQGFTYDANGNQVQPNGMNNRIMATNEPGVQTTQGAAFRDAKTNFLNSYQPTSSLLNEMSGIYQGLQAGPTADVRARISKLANDLDPNGKIPIIHNLGPSSTGEDYDTAMKDIAQITAQRLGGMSQNAPKAETELLSSFAANPDKSPGTVRDVIIRGQALLQQQHDYYKGYDPFRSNQAVPDYTDSFYENHPFENYRSQLEKTVPAFAGQQPNQRNQPGATAAPSAPVTLNANDPDGHYNSLPSGARFVGPDGKVRVKP